MNSKQIKQAKQSYADMFGDDMSDRAIAVAKEVKTHRELEERQDELSAGEYDCLSWEFGQ